MIFFLKQTLQNLGRISLQKFGIFLTSRHFEELQQFLTILGKFNSKFWEISDVSKFNGMRELAVQFEISPNVLHFEI